MYVRTGRVRHSRWTLLQNAGRDAGSAQVRA
jgi:hypothetical protein